MFKNKKYKQKHDNPNYDSKQRAKYGQNYIKDPSLVRRLLDMTTVNNEDTVLEIGPGQGVFTAEILERAGQLVSIEIDEGNVQYLKDMYKDEIKAKQLEIVHKDALLFEHRWAQTNIVDNHYKVVASIPYSISSELFKKFLLKKPMPASAWFTVQREFALRAIARPGVAGSGLLSVLINSFYDCEIVHEFSREDFSPVPNVDSVFLQLIARHDVPELVTMNFGAYKDMLRDGYKQPIKTVQQYCANKIDLNKLQQLADKNKFMLKAHTTELTAKQWQAIFVASVS